jgi:hypothetical protein
MGVERGMVDGGFSASQDATRMGIAGCLVLAGCLGVHHDAAFMDAGKIMVMMDLP